MADRENRYSNAGSAPEQKRSGKMKRAKNSSDPEKYRMQRPCPEDHRRRSGAEKADPAESRIFSVIRG